MATVNAGQLCEPLMDAGLDSLGSVELRNGLAKSVGMELLLAKHQHPGVQVHAAEQYSVSHTHNTGVYKYI